MNNTVQIFVYPLFTNVQWWSLSQCSRG